VGRAIPVRRVRFPSTSAARRARRVRPNYTRAMKKLLILVVFGGLLAVAAKKIRSV
jgi:hypothetical protein